jgi:nucleoside-diphosphate-sugar epimerase
MSEMKNILVTGGTGFIGLHFLKNLPSTHYKLYVLTRKKTEQVEGQAQYIQGDLSNLETLNLPDIHIIVNIAGNKRDESKMLEVNVGGMHKIIALAEKNKAKILHISSAGIYGIEQQTVEIITEETPCLPNNEYERSKLGAEMILTSWGKTNPNRFVSLRPTNVVGEWDNGRKLLNLFKAIQSGKFFHIDKKAMVNYVYAGQVADTMWALIEKDKFQNEFFNSNSPCNIGEFVDMISEELQHNSPIKQLPGFLKPLLNLMANCFELMPSKYRFFSKGKYRELTSHRYYSTAKIQAIHPTNESAQLRLGIRNLVAYYRDQHWL